MATTDKIRTEQVAETRNTLETKPDEKLFFVRFLKTLSLIGRLLLSTVVLVFAVQQCKSALSTHVLPSVLNVCLTPLPPSQHLGHRRALRWAPRATEQLPASCLFYTG